jgi:hypothetical protein
MYSFLTLIKGNDPVLWRDSSENEIPKNENNGRKADKSKVGMLINTAYTRKQV